MDLSYPQTEDKWQAYWAYWAKFTTAGAPWPSKMRIILHTKPQGSIHVAPSPLCLLTNEHVDIHMRKITCVVNCMHTWIDSHVKEFVPLLTEQVRGTTGKHNPARLDPT